jgi:hypothetical protein
MLMAVACLSPVITHTRMPAWFSRTNRAQPMAMSTKCSLFGETHLEQVGDGLGHAVLQLVLDGRGADDVQISLELIAHTIDLVITS